MVVEQVVLGLEVQKEALLQEVEEAACSRHQEEEVAGGSAPGRSGGFILPHAAA